MLPIFFTPTPFFYPFIDFLIAFLSFSSLLLLELFFFLLLLELFFFLLLLELLLFVGLLELPPFQERTFGGLAFPIASEAFDFKASSLLDTLSLFPANEALLLLPGTFFSLALLDDNADAEEWEERAEGDRGREEEDRREELLLLCPAMLEAALDLALDEMSDSLPDIDEALLDLLFSFFEPLASLAFDDEEEPRSLLLGTKIPSLALLLIGRK